MSEVAVNLPLTNQRRVALATFFSHEVLDGDDFICPFFDVCRGSHEGIFYEGQLHHVGNHYDVVIAGEPLRVMVVGQEYGHGPSRVSMDQRSQMVVEQTGVQKDFSKRNPHMRGTTSVLRLLYGIPLGTNHEDEFLWCNNDDMFHLFDAFALVNYLLCSAIGEDGTRSGKSSPIMRRNCLAHFKRTIEILEPTVVIVQGKGYWKNVRKGFTDLTQITETLYLSTLHNQRIMIGVFTHPSSRDNKHNWGRNANTDYLLQKVVPTISIIRQEIFGKSILEGELKMTSPIKKQATSTPANHPSIPYDAIFEEIISGLIQRYPPEFINRNPKYDRSASNRLRIYLDRMKGAHFEICFRRDYYEFALHFESSPAISLERRGAFDPFIEQLTTSVGVKIKSGPLENRGWMRIWYELKNEPVTQEKVNLYMDHYSRFIAATFPILEKMFE